MTRRYRYTVSGLKLDVNKWLEAGYDDNREARIVDFLKGQLSKKLGISKDKLFDLQLIKESIDARKKDNINFTYTVDFSLGFTAKKLKEAPKRVYEDVPYGSEACQHRPLVVGFGPCGMMAALLLAERGFKPIVIERGKSVDKRAEDVERFWNERILDENSNVQFGAGGAGTFSDGKLTTGIKDLRIRKVLKDFVELGAPKDILYKGKPHIGTDVLREVVKNLEKRITSLGGKILYSTCFEHMEFGTDGQLNAIEAIDIKSGEKIKILCNELILAIGHSARDTFSNLYNQGVVMEQKPFSIGVRIEHPQEIIDMAQYGSTGILPPADYKLNHRCENGRGVYTFCMCPGGHVIMAASKDKTVVTNGMSNRSRDSGVANSGLLCDVRTSDFGSDHALAGVEFQERYERLAFENGGGNYLPPKCTWKEFKGKGDNSVRVKNSLPEFAVDAILEAMPNLGRKLKGFDMDEAVFTAVETRSSSPVRFHRNESMEGYIDSADNERVLLKGFYPCGEGAGYAGGIISAACDGIKAAETIIRKYNVL
ncbi:MAG: FAD-dependent monooxygenase [Peptostreptococcaceae bacterium]|nr:FAD-dependent monooxygenase [Peptostreptococcaceae bacterium]MDY5739465.1 FAD-dependent monooxygenase [Anaerovoracaceae bacterium]